MKQIYFVTATNTNVGKTYAAQIFLNKFAKDGKKVGYFKPFETGVIDKPDDGTKLLNLTKQLNKEFDFTIDEIVPFQFKLPAAPFVAAQKENKNIDIDIVFDIIDKYFFDSPQHMRDKVVEIVKGNKKYGFNLNYIYKQLKKYYSHEEINLLANNFLKKITV